MRVRLRQLKSYRDRRSVADMWDLPLVAEKKNEVMHICYRRALGWMGVLRFKKLLGIQRWRCASNTNISSNGTGRQKTSSNLICSA